ncbi:testis-specific gene 10 protein-like [Mercenaria mercenaria]|uniref:testis-specific gene 10 protein-like n=1 Tax=Mercenaria mercenaria TaxID=6596 RepID=UPI00234EF8AB|nr:testis-specific gene 10 protein-like [Mercenaria mercenaria]
MAQRGSSRRDSVVCSLEEKNKQKERAESDRSKQKSEKGKEKTSDQYHYETDFDQFITEIKQLFHQFDEKIDKRFDRLDSKFTKVFEDLKKEMNQIKVEVSDTKNEMKDIKHKVTELEQSVGFQAGKYEELEDKQDDKIRKLHEHLDEMKRKLLLLEKHDRKNNLLFYGFPEEQNEDLKATLKTFFKDKLEINDEKVQKIDFTNCHRLPYDGAGPKPIIARFVYFEDRELIYSKALMPIFKNERKRVLTDLPTELKKTRAKLAKEAYTIRRSERLKTRILEKGLSVYLEVRRTKEDSWERRELYD